MSAAYLKNNFRQG